MKEMDIVQRQIGRYSLPQRMDDGYYEINEFMKQWNDENGTYKRIAFFTRGELFKRFIERQKKCDPYREQFIRTRGGKSDRGRERDKVWATTEAMIIFMEWLGGEEWEDCLLKLRRGIIDIWDEQCDRRNLDYPFILSK